MQLLRKPMAQAKLGSLEGEHRSGAREEAAHPRARPPPGPSSLWEQMVSFSCSLGYDINKEVSTPAH